MAPSDRWRLVVDDWSTAPTCTRRMLQSTTQPDVSLHGQVEERSVPANINLQLHPWTSVHAFVSTSRLDNCNYSLLYGISDGLLTKLQAVTSAGASKYHHITPVLNRLHWLPIRLWIIVKLVTIIFKYLNCSRHHKAGAIKKFCNSLWHN